MILGIETSDIVCSVALWDETNNRLLLESNLEAPMQHAALLAPLVENSIQFAQNEIGKQLRFETELKLVTVAVGPGSFTGLRIGLSFAQGLCFAKGLPIVGVSNHQVLAAQLPASVKNCFTIIDARRHEVYLASLKMENDFPEIVDHRIVKIKNLAEQLPENSWLIKPALHGLNAEVLESLEQRKIKVVENGQYAARFVAQLGNEKLKRHGADDLKTIEPMYIRPFAGVL